MSEKDKQSELALLFSGKSKLVVMLSVMLLGCGTVGTGTTSDERKLSCTAWKPFEYSSKNLKSESHAGKKLAAELAVHNKTGQNLKCWQ